MGHNNKNQSGFAHLQLILVVVAVVAVGSLAFWRVSSSNNQRAHTVSSSPETGENLPANLQGIKTEEEIKQIAGISEGINILKLKLESKDGTYVYILELSNGRKLIIDAQTGKVLSEETTDVSDEDQLPEGVDINISSDKAYEIAVSKHSSPIESIEMEVEDKKVTYKIEYTDGSKIEIDATSGAIVKLDLKDESEDSSDDDSDDDSEDDEDDEEDDEDDDDDEDEEEEDNSGSSN